MIKTTLPAVVLALTLALPLASKLPAQPPEPTPDRPRPEIRYDRSADHAVVEWVGLNDAFPDPTYYPSTKIFGDGRVEVYWPRDRVNAGTYAAYLVPSDLDLLLARLVGLGILEFDEKISKKRLEEAERRRAAEGRPATLTLDAGSFLLILRLARPPYSGGESGASPFEKIIWWGGQPTEAEDYPEVTEVVQLRNAIEILQELRNIVEKAVREGSSEIALPSVKEFDQ